MFADFPLLTGSRLERTSPDKLQRTKLKIRRLIMATASTDRELKDQCEQDDVQLLADYIAQTIDYLTRSTFRVLSCADEVGTQQMIELGFQRRGEEIGGVGMCGLGGDFAGPDADQRRYCTKTSKAGMWLERFARDSNSRHFHALQHPTHSNGRDLERGSSRC